MKEIEITTSQIKRAIDDLVDENEMLQDKVYKQDDKIEELRALYESEREVKEDYKSRNNKAIEYIKQQYKYEETAIEDFDNLLNILQGSDKN